MYYIAMCWTITMYYNGGPKGAQTDQIFVNFIGLIVPHSIGNPGSMPGYEWPKIMITSWHWSLWSIFDKTSGGKWSGHRVGQCSCIECAMYQGSWCTINWNTLCLDWPEFVTNTCANCGPYSLSRALWYVTQINAYLTWLTKNTPRKSSKIRKTIDDGSQ